MLELRPDAERADLSDPLQSTEDKPAIRVLLAAPRGFCAGVRRAIDAVRDALRKHGPPVYVRRAIVHNMEVVRGLEAEGAVFVEELDEVPRGSIVIFSAHGVAPAIAADARLRGLISYDAVCPLVAKVHREVERHQRGGRQLVLIGHEGHPEIEGTLGHVAGVNACVVKSVGDVARLPFDAAKPTAYAIQTTYSVEDAHEIVEALREKFADLAGPATSDICYATTNRQAAAREIALQSDAVVVVGERFSSNASRLAEVAGSICERVQLVAEPGEIDWTRMPNEGAVGITAAASTPERAVQAVLHAFRDRYRVTIEELESIREATVFKPLALT